MVINRDSIYYIIIDNFRITRIVYCTIYDFNDTENSNN